MSWIIFCFVYLRRPKSEKAKYTEYSFASKSRGFGFCSFVFQPSTAFIICLLFFRYKPILPSRGTQHSSWDSKQRDLYLVLAHCSESPFSFFLGCKWYAGDEQVGTLGGFLVLGCRLSPGHLPQHHFGQSLGSHCKGWSCWNWMGAMTFSNQVPSMGDCKTRTLKQTTV